MSGPLARIKTIIRSASRRLRPLQGLGPLSVDASLAAAGYYLGRATGSMQPAGKTLRRFETCERRESALLCIYRQRNRATVTALVEQARRRGMRIALWALDDPLPEISAHTVGCGPGPRMELLNRLWQSLGSDSLHQLVVTDDDIVFTRGSLDRLLGAAVTCEFGIAQPAHAWTSQYSHPINRQRPFLLARHSTFVEPGPMFVVTQPWIGQVMPFPDDFGMGWGIWLLWQDLQPQGCRLGIIDCVTVKHPSLVATDYTSALDNEYGRLWSLLRAHGYQSTEEAQQILGSWKMGQRLPPWTVER